MNTSRIKLGLQLNRLGIVLFFFAIALHVALKLPDLSALGVLLAFTGQVLALATPREGGRTLLILSLLTGPVSLLLMAGVLRGVLVHHLLPLVGLAALALAALAGHLLTLAGILLFLAYLAQLARYLQRPDLARQALTLAVVGLVSLAALAATALVPAELRILVLLSVGVIALASVVAFSGLLGRLCEALD